MKMFEYRLYSNEAQRRLLMACLAETRTLYNEMLAYLKAQYEPDGTFPGKYTLDATFKGHGGEHVPATMVQCLADRLTKALKSMCNHPAIGIDVGLKVFLADSEGHTVENPRFYRTPQKALRRKQRQLSRRKQGSYRRHLAARTVAKTHLKINRQRCDHHFKVAKQYAERYQRIVVEDLRILNMVKNHHLSKSIMDASWGAFLAILSAKAASAGHEVIRVNPRFTSQKCHQCGEIVQKSLSVRTHVCPFCGYVTDRDVNAAKNILQAGAPPSGTALDGERDELRSPAL
jgi:IS605 OrfB family transposase